MLFIIFILILTGCTQPIAKSGTTLLSSGSSTDSNSDSGGNGDTGTTPDTGELEIRADNQELTVNVDENDRVEISGNCSTLNRKSNRILVEVFSGENETVDAYISNAISDRCQAAFGIVTGNGIPVGDPCFWVTRGTGLIEDIGLPEQKSFPQCINGRFGFSVRLGAVMVDPAPVGSRYTVRFKLRTNDGGPAETPWSRVYVTRKLVKPTFEKVVADHNAYTCTLDMSPARFNQNITYMLSRATNGGFGSANLPAFNVFNARINSLDITPGSSAYNWVSTSSSVPDSVIAGVTYTYTLQSQDQTDYFTQGGFSYALPGLFETSDIAACTINRHIITQTGQPTNTPIAIPGGLGPACFFGLANGRPINPGASATGPVEMEWAYSTTSAWTGANKDGATGGAVLVAAQCAKTSNCTISQFSNGIAPGTTYYVAMREKVREGLGSPQVPGGRDIFGKWSDEVSCVTPPNPP